VCVCVCVCVCAFSHTLTLSMGPRNKINEIYVGTEKDLNMRLLCIIAVTLRRNQLRSLTSHQRAGAVVIHFLSVLACSLLHYPIPFIFTLHYFFACHRSRSLSWRAYIVHRTQACNLNLSFNERVS
jgi:hypothetical protein